MSGPRTVRSIGSAGSILSIGSAGSILSIGSAGSILSIGSAGSILSIGSAGSILSIGSAGSLLSIGSSGSVLSIGSSRSVLAIGSSGSVRSIGSTTADGRATTGSGASAGGPIRIVHGAGGAAPLGHDPRRRRGPWRGPSPLGLLAAVAVLAWVSAPGSAATGRPGRARRPRAGGPVP